jgi:hypothetical protein
VVIFDFCLDQAHAPYTALHTLSLLQLPIDLEVNVSNSSPPPPLLLHLESNPNHSLFDEPPIRQMSTFLHRVRGPTIGFSCLDLFVVTNSSISNVSFLLSDHRQRINNKNWLKHEYRHRQSRRWRRTSSSLPTSVGPRSQIDTSKRETTRPQRWRPQSPTC